ncbi:MAG: chromosome segregation protein SMC [Planctomycetes bacterium]|nr:chromosome segregation protein SMC [Planctomycetota bacterium]
MRLKRLELFGFKSFADRTTLSFDHSLVGIVGPNGCGKSNVVDAIRWVLGETRPTSMRGGEMTDVIFKGSVSRPSMSIAEVSLVLDNSQGELGDRGAEVSITRRVDRSGEGEYLINGQRVRLKDVRDMLYDTGLGSRGYAVLEQGRIDAVLSADPLARRAIFEEAAGISRYRQRKKETETRLKRVETDVQRLDDILRELSSRVRSLKIQAGKAERYVAARDEWKTERTRFLKHRVWQLDGALVALRTKIGALEGESTRLRTQREGEESDAAAREQHQRQLAADVDRLADEVARLFGEGRTLSERSAQIGERVAAWRKAAEEENDRALGLAQAAETREAEVERLLAERAQKEEIAAAASQTFGVIAGQLEDVRRTTGRVRDDHERQNQAVLRLLHQKTAAQNTLVHLDESQKPLAERRERARVRFEESTRAADELRGAEGAARERVASLEGDITRGEAARAEIAARIGEHDRRAQELSAEKNRLDVERARLSSRIDALLDWDREREALEAGARALISGVSRGETPVGSDALRGVLADHLRTSTRFARALDAALGERALALVATDGATAATLVRWLSEKRAGSVRLVVPGAARRERRADFAFAAEHAELVQGRLAEALECADDVRVLAEVLVGDVWLARDIAAAFTLVGAYPELRFVTLEGDLVDAAGVFGGHREIAQGAVGRRSTAQELEKTRDEVVARLERVVADLEEAARVRRELESERQSAEARVQALREAFGQAKSESHTVRARLSDLEDALKAHGRECDALAQETERLQRDIRDAHARVVSVEDEYGRAATKLAELETARRDLEVRRDELQRAHGQAEVEATRARTELGSIQARARDLERALAEAKQELERTRRLATEHAESARAGAEESTRLAAEASALEAKRAERDRELGELRRTERAGRDAIEAFRRRVDAVTRELEGLTADLSTQRLDEQRLGLERADLVGRAREELSLGEQELLENFTPEDALLAEGALASLEARVVELKQNLDRLGPVNTESVAELAEAETRFDFLDGERKDLARARQTLEEALAEINRESERLFLETFEDVRTHFQTLFRQLFGGGKADLVMMPGEGPLEAGIEITARPPGREMLPIGLLSGGQRTMTALALLFAVFQARPSPFCVLDEVDAALDDANVGRFLGMLDNFRRHTQFVVVTHNKGTMAACSALYGVTMEVKGVSRHVAVQFGDVDRIDPQATGNASAAVESRAEVRARADAESPADAEAPDATAPGREPRHGAAGAGDHGNGVPGDGETADGETEPVVELAPAKRASRAKSGSRASRNGGPHGDSNGHPVDAEPTPGSETASVGASDASNGAASASTATPPDTADNAADNPAESAADSAAANTAAEMPAS